MSILVSSGRFLFPWRLVIGLLAVVLAGFFIRPEPMLVHSWLFQIISLLVVIAGLALRAWGAAYAGRHTRSDSIEAPRLATAGPYGYVRNPIYLGSLILGLGMVGLLGDLRLLALYAVTFALLFVAIIPAEEAFLKEQFGEEYERYCECVPRIFPRLLPWRSGVIPRADWLSAKGDAWLALLLVCIFLGLRLAVALRAA